MVDRSPNDKKNYRDEEGAVRIGPKNFYTSSKGLILDGKRRRDEFFNRFPEHIPDDYTFP